MAPRPPKSPLPLRPKPRTSGEWERDQYCKIEAEREVESWFTGDPYQWRPFDERNWNCWDDLALVKPVDFFVLTK